MSRQPAHLETEVINALMFNLLRSAPPEIIVEALSQNPNEQRIAEMLRDWNFKQHPELMGRAGRSTAAQRPPKGASKQAARSESIRNVRAIFENGLAGR